MNYFEFYDIPVSFSPDQNLVKKKFYALSKAYHPDFYVNESEEKQQEILELSTLNNKAYQTLKDANKCLAYVLDLYGEISEGEKYTLPSDFLMEMMEVNEALMELEFDQNPPELERISKEVDLIENNLDQDLASFIVQFEGLKEDDIKLKLKDIKDIFYRKKYLLRIRKSINTFASRPIG
jgi:molecular chaperone HscB